MDYDLPNFQDVSGTAPQQARPDAGDWRAIGSPFHGSFTISGGACTPGTGMSVDVTAWSGLVGGTPRSVAASNVALSAAASDPRIDLVVVNAAGALEVLEGTPAAVVAGASGPVWPAGFDPDTQALLCRADVRPGQPTLATTDLRDRRRPHVTAGALQDVWDVVTPTHTVGIDIGLSVAFGAYTSFTTPGTYTAGTDWTATGGVDRITVGPNIITNDPLDPLDPVIVSAESNIGAPVDFGALYLPFNYPSGKYRMLLGYTPSSKHWGVRAFADLTIVTDGATQRVDEIVVHPNRTYTYDAAVARYKRFVYLDGSAGDHFDPAGDTPALNGALSIDFPDPYREAEFWFGMNRVDPLP